MHHEDIFRTEFTLNLNHTNSIQGIGEYGIGIKITIWELLLKSSQSKRSLQHTIFLRTDVNKGQILLSSSLYLVKLNKDENIQITRSVFITN